MRPVLFLDLSRLVRRFEHLGGPTGIDRIELAFARWMLRQDAFDARAVTRAGGGLVALRPAAVPALVAELDRRWGSEAPPQFGRGGRGALRFAAERVAGRARRWRLLAGAGPLRADGPSVTLSVGHDGLDEVARWSALPGAFAAILSDIIPLTHPEYDSPRATLLHRRRVATLERHADHVFTISDAAAEVIAAATPARRFTMSTLYLGPGLAPPAEPMRFVRPTFVHLSSVDRRKNLAFLLQLWREMAADGDAPDLLAIGRRGNDASALHLIEACEAIRPYVTATGGLGDAEVARRLAGATALLTASFTEGYGLPIVEAHRLGVPVIASDIPPHREIGGPSTVYLNPLDGPGWIRAIRADAAGGAAARRAAILPPPTWEAVFDAATETLLRLAR